MTTHWHPLTLFSDRNGRFSLLKTLTFATLLLPGVNLLYRAAIHDLGPLPYKEALHVTGDYAVYFLVAALALTPLQRIWPGSRLALIRRMVGVGAFAYAAIHLSLYMANEKFHLGFIASEIVLRPYLTIGFIALTGLAALAATSTDGMIRRMGARWKQLHRLVYVIGPLAIVHYFMQSKIDVTAATLVAGLFLTLMIYRLALARRLALTAPVLAGLALAGAIATAGAEALWYGLATGVDVWRVLEANVMVTFGLRPSAIVLLAGLAVAALPQFRRLGTMVWNAAAMRRGRACLIRHSVLDSAPASARSSAG